MSYVIRYAWLTGKSLTGTPPDVKEGDFLASYDPDAHNGRGFAKWTPSPFQAMRFDSKAEAIALYQQRSKVRPIRDDGKPNKPLTAFTVWIDPWTDVVPDRIEES